MLPMRVMSQEIRAEKPGDVPAVREVNCLAFVREDEARLVDDLRNGTHARISLVARREDKIIGHVMFSSLSIETERGSVEALAPVAVVPESVPQRQSLHVHQHPGPAFRALPTPRTFPGRHRRRILRARLQVRQRGRQDPGRPHHRRRHSIDLFSPTRTFDPIPKG
jgi:hypothetical protein